MQIPTGEQCYRLMCDMKMMDHIVVHSMQVCRVATFLVDHLNAQQNRLNYHLIRAAALLHDITKTRSFKTEENHALTGGQFLAKAGYPEVGELVRQHVRLDVYPNPVVLGEAEIISYADKRVLHDKVVSLDKRMDYILGKYGKSPEHQKRIRWLWRKTQNLEDKIFCDLSLAPEDINRILTREDRLTDFLQYQKVCDQASDPVRE
jgi:putative nucleotidyltransferase with HDIG domain